MVPLIPVPHVEVLRLGHRPDRDKRITTHVALVARAFLAKAVHIDQEDKSLERNIERMTSSFGGDFNIETGVKYRKMLSRWGGTIVHLTMYGTPLDQALVEIPRDERILVVVGSEKVPGDVYDLSHFNVGVTNQPHSEVSALAVFLDRFFMGREMDHIDRGGVLTVLPRARGKTVRERGHNPSGETHDPFEADWPAVPDAPTCLSILKAVGCSKPVIAHCRAVHAMGMDMVKASRRAGLFDGLGADIGLLEAGLLLHDMGRSRTHSIRHVVHGAILGKRLGLDERLINIIHNHPGAGIPAEEAASIGLPQEDFIPRTLEEKLVCHADNLVGSIERRPLRRTLNGLREKGALGAVKRMEGLHAELERTLGIDIDALLGPTD